MKTISQCVGQLAFGLTVLLLVGCASAPHPAFEPAAQPAVEPPRPAVREVVSVERPMVLQDATSTDPQQAPPQTSAFAKDRLLLYRLDVGMRQFDGSWDPIDQPLVIGGAIMYEPAYWPLGMEVGLSFATADDSLDGSGYRSTNYELTFGGCKSFWPVKEKLIWTFGGGLALTYTRDRFDIFTPPTTTETFKGNDWWLAGYLHTRLAWMLSDSFDIGLDLRGMTGQSVSTVGPVRDTENGQLLLSLGFHR